MATQTDQPGIMLYWEAFELLNELGPTEIKEALSAIYQYAKDGTEPDFGGNRVLRITWVALRGSIDRNKAKYNQVRQARREAGQASAAKRAQTEPEATNVDFVEQIQQSSTNLTNVDFVEQTPTKGNKAQQTPTKGNKGEPCSTNPTIVTINETINGTINEAINETVNEAINGAGVKADKPPSAKRFTPPSADDVRAYCKEQGYNVDAERFVDYYASRGWMVGKAKMKDWRAAVRNWARDENSKPTPAPPARRDVTAGIYGHDTKVTREDFDKLLRMEAKIRGE